MATNLFTLMATIGLNDSSYNKGIDSAEKKGKSFAEKLGGAVGSAAKKMAQIGTAAVATVATGAVAIGKKAVESYASYEQLVGGVDTLFKNSSNLVQQYADNAYKTAGMSANAYMETVTSFSASLLQSLGGDTEKAAKVGDMAVTDMSDNANKMGTSIDMIQNAYQGFAKQNYTMLDNLKLGYGGTKTEMERLLADAGKLSGQKYDISNLNDVYEAIHVVQGELGITGTTALEASTTIEGSANSMKGAWQNLLTGIADDNADFDTLMNNLVDSVMTFASNILPRIQTTLGGITKLVSGIFEKLLPEITPILTDLISQMLPVIINGASTLITEISNALPELLNIITENADDLANLAVTIITTLGTTLIEQLPTILQAGIDILLALINGITEAIPDLIPTIIEVVLNIVSMLTNPDTLNQLLNAGIELIFALIDGIIDALPDIIEAIPKIIDNIVQSLAILMPQIIVAGVEIIIKLAAGIIKAIPTLVKAIPKVIKSIVDAIGTYYSKWEKIGKNIVEGIKEGIKNAWNNFTDWFKGLFDDVIGIAKKILGIASPSKVFKGIGKFIDEGLALGIDQNLNVVNSSAEDLAYATMPVDDDFYTVKTFESGTNQGTVRNQQQNVNVTIGVEDGGMGLARYLYKYLKIVKKEVTA